MPFKFIIIFCQTPCKARARNASKGRKPTPCYSTVRDERYILAVDVFVRRLRFTESTLQAALRQHVTNLIYFSPLPAWLVRRLKPVRAGFASSFEAIFSEAPNCPAPDLTHCPWGRHSGVRLGRFQSYRRRSCSRRRQGDI